MTDDDPFATPVPTAGARRLAIVRVLLATTAWVTTTALAARAGVTPRTIFRDIAELRSTGVPIAGQVGRGVRLDWQTEVTITFDLTQIVAVADTLRTACYACHPATERTTDDVDRKVLMGALFALFAGLPKSLRVETSAAHNRRMVELCMPEAGVEAVVVQSLEGQGARE